MAETTKYPYTTVPGKLRDLLKKVPSLGRPEKLTVAWLKKAGWTSSNDTSMIPVLKFVDILSPDGRPTDLWDAVRVQDRSGRGHIADAIRKAYADLFNLHPDAHRKDAEALRNFFRAHTSGGEQVQTKMIQSFQVLTEFADFDTQIVGEDAEDRTSAQHPTADRTPARLIAASPDLTLNVNIQLQLPATLDGDVYEKLFAAMRRHLIDLAETSAS